MVLYSSIAHRITYADYGQSDDIMTEPLRTAFESVFRQAYEGSPSLAAALNAWLESNSENFVVEFAPGFADAPPGSVRIDPAMFSNARYVTTDGQVVADTFLSGLVHELGHALTPKVDNDSFTDLTGEAVALTNDWLNELGLSSQASYHAYEVNFPTALNLSDIGNDVLVVGQSYTNGETVENVILDVGYYDNTNNGGFAFDSANVDLLAEGLTGKSLLIGSNEDNHYGGTDSRDFIYGNGGNDVLYGYAGDDRMLGGEGSDILRGGDGRDVIIDQQVAPSSDIYIQPSGWGSPIHPVIGSIEAGSGDDQITIDIGGIPGLTFGGDEYGYGPGPELPSVNDNGFNYFLRPGQGNDVTDINFNGQLEYKYDRGDGIDQIRLQSAGTFGLSTNPNEFPLSTLEMTALTVDASAYSRAEADITFSVTSRQLVMIDPPGGDNADLYVIKGSVTIAFSDGGLITIDDMYGVVAEDWRFADENEFNVYNARFPFQIRFSDEEVNQIGIAGSAFGRSSASSSIAPLNEVDDFGYRGGERLSFPTALASMRERTLHDTFEVPLMNAGGWPASIHDALQTPMEDAAFAAVARHDGDQSARRLHLDPSQHELAGGPTSAVLDLQSYLTANEAAVFGSQTPADRESVVAQSLESYLGSSPDTDVVRKLAIIRQDMSTFGVVSGLDSERLRPDMPESIYFYA